MGVDEALIRSRSAEARVARLATTTVGGRPHVVPCCFAIGGDRIYTAVDDVKAKSTLDLRRLANIRLHPAVSVLVDHYSEDWTGLWWIRMDGCARVSDPGSPEHGSARELLAAKYEQYAHRPPPGPVIAIQIEAWRAWP